MDRYNDDDDDDGDIQAAQQHILKANFCLDERKCISEVAENHGAL